MTRSKKSDLVNRTRFSGALRNDLYMKLDELSKHTRIQKNPLYDEAIELLLEKYDIKLPDKR